MPRATIGGGASSVLGSEADFERRSIDLRAGRGWRWDIAAAAEAGGDQRSGWGAWRICYLQVSIQVCFEIYSRFETSDVRFQWGGGRPDLRIAPSVL